MRADVGCKHQPASGAPPATLDRQAKEKKKPAHANSLWGWKGNPAGPARERMMANAKKMRE